MPPSVSTNIKHDNAKARTEYQLQDCSAAGKGGFGSNRIAYRKPFSPRC
jgi:hypothetical protein